MGVRVEFYGIPRRRAGQDSVMLPVAGDVSLRVILAELRQRFPALGAECLDGDRLRAGFLANLDGNQFLYDPETPIADHACVLILSSDAGG